MNCTRWIEYACVRLGGYADRPKFAAMSPGETNDLDFAEATVE